MRSTRILLVRIGKTIATQFVRMNSIIRLKNKDLRQIEFKEWSRRLNVTNCSFWIFCLLAFVAVATFQQTVLAETEYGGSCSRTGDLRNLPPGTWCELPHSKLADAEKKPVE